MKNVLLIFDIGGVLCDSVHKRHPHIPFDFRSGKKYVYLRPGIVEFLHWVNLHFSIAVWTSCVPHNTMPIIQHLFHDHGIYPLFVYTRDQCTKLPNYKTHKNLYQQIWNHSDWRDQWNPSNTFLIDDSPEKSLYPDNLILIHSFVPGSCVPDRDIAYLAKTLEQFIPEIDQCQKIESSRKNPINQH
jgi:hypothetical protein